jgi:hypothetical protein
VKASELVPHGIGCSREVCYARDTWGKLECSIVCLNQDDAGEERLKDEPLFMNGDR